MTPEERKRYRERANRAKRELLKEKEQYGYINDGSGKRYLAPVYYVLAGNYVWHGSTQAASNYLREVKEYLHEPTPTERHWMAAEYNSQPFETARQEY